MIKSTIARLKQAAWSGMAVALFCIAPNASAQTSQTSGLATRTAAVTARAADSAVTRVAKTAQVQSGSTAITVPAGQPYSYTFSGTAGQLIDVGMENVVTGNSGDSVVATILNPDGSTLMRFQTSAGTPAYSSPGALPQTGQYTVTINTGSGGSATLNFLMDNQVTATAGTDGGVVPITLSNDGQTATISFTATAGQTVTLLVANDIVPNYLTSYVYQPNGSLLSSLNNYYYNGTGGIPNRGAVVLSNLPASGTYTIHLVPNTGYGGTTGATGSLQLSLELQATGPAQVGGTTAVSLTNGQQGSYTFTGTAGQIVDFGLDNVSVTANGAPVNDGLLMLVYNPDGSRYFYMEAANGSPAYQEPGALPQSGQYTIVLQVSNGDSASANIIVSTETPIPLTLGAPATPVVITQPGQGATLTFYGVAGQNLDLLFDTDIVSGYIGISVYQPSGALIASNGLVGNASSPGLVSVLLHTLPVTGTYSIHLAPNNESGVMTGATGSLNVAAAVGTWQQHALPASNYWWDVAFGNGTFASVSYGTVVALSKDGGATWTEGTLPVNDYWEHITYGNGNFFALTRGSNAGFSPDGITWNASALPVSAAWAAVAAGNNKYIALESNGVVAVATETSDGITWQQSALSSAVNWNALGFGNGTFVALASGSNSGATSTDGMSWTPITLPASAAWKAVTYGNGIFVAIAANSAIAAVSTDNGATWTQQTLSASGPWVAIAFGVGQFVAISGNPSSDVRAASSPDGINWTNNPLPQNSNWIGLAYGNNDFVAVSGTNGTLTANLLVPGPPSIVLNSPSSGQTWNAGSGITLSATPSVSGATVTQVAYYNGSTLIGTVTQSPYSYNWANATPGNDSISAVVTDSTGHTASSNSATISVSGGMDINITSPANNARLTGTSLTLSVSVNSSGSTITQVAYFNGSALMATTNQAPYTIVLPDAGSGVYQLTAQVTNADGQVVVSTPVDVTLTEQGAGGGSTGSGGEVMYDIHTDQLNTPRMITDQGGNVVWQWDNQDPFGNNIPNQDPNGTGNQLIFNPRFAGQYFDIETGTHYNYFRDYDPSIGRYVQSDPIGLRGGQFSTYAYVAGNPLSFADPYGLNPAGAAWGFAWPTSEMSLGEAISVLGLDALGIIVVPLSLGGDTSPVDKGPPAPMPTDNPWGNGSDSWGDNAPSKMAAPGNQADTGITQTVTAIQSQEVMEGNKRPDRCDVLQQLIDSGKISALAAKATQKAWGCRPSRQSKDKCKK